MTNLSDCMFCSKSLQCPDGALRCSVTSSLANEICGEFESGHPTVLKIEYHQSFAKRTRQTYRRKK